MRLVSFRSVRHFAGALGMAALLGTVALPAPVVPKEKAPAPAQRLRKELDKSIDFETTDQPLDLALDQLREQTKINFVLDRQTLAQMNIDPNQTPIKVKLKEARVKTVLRTILGAHNLGYAIIGDTVFVSSDEMTMFRQMQQRVNLDVEKVEFAAALRQLSRETATNLIIDSRVAKEANQTVSLQVEDVPLETAVRLLAEMVGLKPVRVGNVLFVCTKAHAQELRADPDLAPRPVNPYAPPENILVPGAPPAVVPARVVPAPVPVPPAAPVPPPPPEKPADKEKEI